MSTTGFEEALAFVLKWEGSKFTNDPDDHGGPTRYGIIQREYDRYRIERGLSKRSVEFISFNKVPDEVREIYRREYWQAVQGDRMPGPLDLVMFDTGVLNGVGRAIRLLQQSLNISVDGVLGTDTFDALALADGGTVATDILDRREARFREIVKNDPTQAKFLKGWLNRLNDLRRTIQQPLLKDPILDNADLFSANKDVAMGRAGSDPYEDFRNTGDNNPADSNDLSGLPDSDLLSAIALTNYGAESTGQLFMLPVGNVASPFFEPPTLPINIDAAHAFLESCMNSSPRVEYGLGAKISPHGAKPGKDFTRVDCSGFVRETVWRATSPGMNFPDGSVQQHDWIIAQKFQRSTQSDATLQDGKVRIAFLRRQEAPGPKHVGHVALVHNGRTLESHGSVGPDSRDWDITGWQAKAFVYVLAN
jgi:lysozyme family protein